MTVTLTQLASMRFDPASHYLFSDVVHYDPDGSQHTVRVKIPGHRTWNYKTAVDAILAAAKQ